MENNERQFQTLAFLTRALSEPSSSKIVLYVNYEDPESTTHPRILLYKEKKLEIKMILSFSPALTHNLPHTKTHHLALHIHAHTHTLRQTDTHTHTHIPSTK